MSLWEVLGWNVFAGHFLHSVSDDEYIPTPHIDESVQVVSRCASRSWCVSAGHAWQLRFAVSVSAVMSWSFPHFGCVAHSVFRCAVSAMYALLPQALHVSCAVVDSAAEICCPALQNAWILHRSYRCVLLSWNVLSQHASHSLFAVRVSLEMYSPFPHVACTRHAASLCETLAW